MSKRSHAGSHSPLAAALRRPPTKAKAKADRTSLAVSPEVAERLRDAAAWEREPVKAFTEAALLAEVERREREHGEGFTYPPRKR